jgi:hypothetical protein
MKITDLKNLKGDKYSNNLRKWLKKHDYDYMKAIWIKWDCIDGIESKEGSIYLFFSMDGPGYTGAELKRITTSPNSATGCFIGFGKVSCAEIEQKDVTEWFIKNYIEKGACLIHRFNHDYIQINKNSRKCRHCGDIQTRTIKQQKINKRVECWA